MQLTINWAHVLNTCDIQTTVQVSYSFISPSLLLPALSSAEQWSCKCSLSPNKALTLQNLHLLLLHFP